MMCSAPPTCVQDERSAWTTQLEPGPDCSIGHSTNEAMNWDGTSSSGRQNEDRWVCQPVAEDSPSAVYASSGHRYKQSKMIAGQSELKFLSAQMGPHAFPQKQAHFPSKMGIHHLDLPF